MSKARIQTTTFQHWLALIFVITALLLLAQAHASNGLKLLLAAVGGTYVVWNVWHHNSERRVSVDTFLEYGLVALITWFVFSSVIH